MAMRKQAIAAGKGQTGAMHVSHLTRRPFNVRAITLSRKTGRARELTAIAPSWPTLSPRGNYSASSGAALCDELSQ